MLKLIFAAISLYLLFRILNKKKPKKPVNKTGLGKLISNWNYEEEKTIKQDPLYSSRHESTPMNEKSAEEIVTKHEKIARESMKDEKLKQ